MLAFRKPVMVQKHYCLPKYYTNPLCGDATPLITYAKTPD